MPIRLFHALRHADVDRRIGAGLTSLLVVQSFTMFAVIPFGVAHPQARMLLDGCHVAFAAICVTVLTGSVIVRTALILAILSLLIGPFASNNLPEVWRPQQSTFFEGIAFVAFVFNSLVTAVVARHVFAGGRVTSHRVRGAVLLYLNVAALFSIAYAALEARASGSFLLSSGGHLPDTMQTRVAALSYFSLTTITTTGYGDILPVSALAKSLANSESVFGHLFPATLLARIVALHIAHSEPP